MSFLFLIYFIFINVTLSFMGAPGILIIYAPTKAAK